MARATYQPDQIEPKWQAYWADQQTFRTPIDPAELAAKPKAYILDMFPYLSGEGLHVGHPKGYTASDVFARLRRMQGYNVLHPMGWDAFGLPTERAAERANIDPATITERNIVNFRRQMQRIGFSYDWAREINTAAPDYYQWTQWIFLKLYERGLAYMADVPVNWCPALGTVLSNEEVHDGKYIETGDLVERRLMRQWMLRITAYAERLIDDLATVDWPEGIKEQQRNWIGRSEGALVEFTILDLRFTNDGAGDAHSTFTVFTTRPDTLFGVTYCVLAPEHPLVAQITTAEQRAAVEAYVTQARNQSDMQRTALNQAKSGVFTGAYALNPVNQQPVPIWVADYVLLSYGTGAIMGVPAHDERDHAFARQFNLPIVEVIQPHPRPEWAPAPLVREGEQPHPRPEWAPAPLVREGEQPHPSPPLAREGAYSGDGVCINSGFLDGLAGDAARAAMISWLEENGHGQREVQYRLRDWLFSRQRYWGEPFPIVHLADGTIAAIPADQLPVELPELSSYKPTADGKAPLARAGDDWLLVTLPDGRVGVRETNTMPQWAGSCWYYLRFVDPHNPDQPWAKAAEQYWLPVDLYIGGVEHAVLHLLYARFWHKVLYDCGLVASKEPFQQLFNQGLILAHSYRDANGKYYYPEQVTESAGQWLVKATGRPVSTQLEKMSKSRFNIVSLDAALTEYGADALRLYEVFIGPVSAGGPWQTNGIEGTYRFLQRVWRLVIDEQSGALNPALTAEPASSQPGLQRELHRTIQRVTAAIESLDKMNTAVSHLMSFVNAASQTKTLPVAIIKELLALLAPFAPHLADELWQRLGETGTLAYGPWPQPNETLLAAETVQIPVQINGKLRAVIDIAADADAALIQQVALQHEKIQRSLNGHTIAKVIVAPGRLVNFLTSE